MKKKIRIFASRTGIILTGAVIGIIAPLLQRLGNPPNMGICVACFERDIAGALGLHRASVVQNIRPEIIGFVLGATAAALIFREFKARSGSAPLIRFVLGVFAMIGALAFLGCPWRAVLRLAGGDLNALIGIAGLVSGIFAGVLFLRRGFSLGRSNDAPSAVGWIMPALMTGLLLLALFMPKFSEGGAVFRSEKGPGAMSASLFISLGAGIVIGFIAQRSRFCTMGAFRDAILVRDSHLLSGVGALLAAAFIVNLIFGQVNPGYYAQPVAHSSAVWNFLGMSLAGLCFTLAGGCPGRQLFLAGEGNADSGVFVLGMVTGAAFAHNFNLAGKPDSVVDGTVISGGISPYGMIAVCIGLAAAIIFGFTSRDMPVNHNAPAGEKEVSHG